MHYLTIGHQTDLIRCYLLLGLTGRCRIAMDDQSHHWNSHLDLCRVFDSVEMWGIGFSDSQTMSDSQILKRCRILRFSDSIWFSAQYIADFQKAIVVKALSHNRSPDGFDSPWVPVRRCLILGSSDDVGFSDSQTMSDSQIPNSDCDWCITLQPLIK